MVLVSCIECNKKISDRAIACPHCGCPNEPQAEPQRRIADQQRKRVLGREPNAGLPDSETLKEIQRKNKFYALLRAQYWKIFASLFSFVVFIVAFAYPIYLSISTGSGRPLILLLLPFASLAGAGAFFNIKPSFSGIILAIVSFTCFTLAGIIIEFGFANAGGIDGSKGYWLVGWLLFASYWLVNRKAPSEVVKAARLPFPEEGG